MGPQQPQHDSKPSQGAPAKHDQPPQRWVKRYKTEVSAGMSSVLSTAAAFPLDSVKTRMQTYKYSGFLDCVRHTYQTEHLRGFFRGSSPPLSGWGQVLQHHHHATTTANPPADSPPRLQA